MFARKCTSVSPKAGSNLPKKRMCRHIFDWSQRGLGKCSSFPEEPVACWDCNGRVLFIAVMPFRLLLCRCNGLQHFVPFLHPSSPPLLHLFSSRSSPISSSEIKGKHRGGRWDRWRLASGWAGAQSVCSLIKYPHCVKFPLLSHEICQFYLCL